MDIQSSRYDQAVSCLSHPLRESLRNVPLSVKQAAQEIRLRVGAPIAITCPGQIWFLGRGSELHNLPQKGHCVARADLEDSVVTMCSHSVHTHQNEMKGGFISLTGGHRAGICGTAVMDGGKVSAVRDITSVNLRIAKEVPGVAAPLIEGMLRERLRSMLIAGPPSSGKTTLLRDLARQLSSGMAGRFYKVAIVDERCELAAVHEGIPQNSLGPCCDVLSGYPKEEGILMAVRTLSPQVVVCDEIGGREEVEGILDGINCGVKVIATAHAESLGELLRRQPVRRLLEQGAFERVVMLGSGDTPGQVRDILEVGDMLDQIGGAGSHRAMLLDNGRLHGIRLIEASPGD